MHRRKIQKRFDQKQLLISMSFALVLFLLVILIPKSAHAATIEPIYKVLQTQSAVKNVWNQVLTFVNSLGIIILIFVAFANILRVNINNYAIKKILPTMVLAIIAANFSYLFCRILVDVANVACSLLINGSAGSSATITASGAVQNVNNAFDFVTKYSVSQITVDNYGVYLLYALGEFAGTVCILILAFLFFIRNYIIYFLVALAPLAFASLILPQTKSVFNQWWSNMWKWTFLPIVSLFWLWLGGQWANSAILSGAGIILTFGFAAACYYLAITTPFKMGGTIMQQWGNLGKKAWGLTGGAAAGAAGEYSKRKAGIWWAGQAKSTNNLNPLGHIARIGTNMKMAKEFDEAQLKNNIDAARANIRTRSRVGRKRTEAEDKFGGEEEKAKAEVLGKHYEENPEAAQAKARWLDEKATAEQRLTTALGAGQLTHAASTTGENLRVQRERLAREAFAADQEIQLLQKATGIEFLTNSGNFKDEEGSTTNKDLLDRVMLGMSRNLIYDEVVKKTQQENIDEVLESQQHLGDMHGLMSGINESIRRIDDHVASKIQGDIDELELKVSTGQATGMERIKLAELRADLSTVQNGGSNSRIATVKNSLMTQFNSEKEEIARAAKAYIEANPDKQYLDGMVEMNATDPDEIVRGFTGLVEKQGFTAIRGFNPKQIGGLVQTRTGKLVSIEIKGDIEKRLDEKTVTEIARDLDVKTTTIGTKLKLADGQTENPEQVLENFRTGRRYLNDPQSNREIEARMLSLAKVAKQTSNADSPAAAAGLAIMMSDEAAIGARNKFNALLKQQGASSGFITDTDPAAVRSKFVTEMGTGGRTQRRAYTAVMDQPTMGTSKNPAEYLSTAFDTSRMGYHPTSQNPNADINADRLARGLVSTISGMGPKISYSRLASALGQNTSLAAAGVDSMSTMLSTQRTRFAEELAKQMGISLKPELRKGFVEALSKLPKTATPAQVAAKVQEVVPGVAPKIDEKIVTNIIGTSQNMARTQQAIQVLSQKQNVEDHQPYLDHFQNMSREQAETQAKILSEARQQVEHNPNTDEAMSAIARALQQTGYAPAQANLASGPNQIDQLMMAEQAAQAALKSYDETGQYHPDQAVDHLAEYFVEKDRIVNREVETDVTDNQSPGLHQDIKPPSTQASSQDQPPTPPPAPTPNNG